MFKTLCYKNPSRSGSCSIQNYPLLVLLRILLKNANFCRSPLLYSGSCTPLVSSLRFKRRSSLEHRNTCSQITHAWVILPSGN